MTRRSKCLAAAAVAAGLVATGLLTLVVPGRDAPARRGEPAAVTKAPGKVDVRAEIEQAYLRYWEVYAEALRRLDDSRLGEVLAGAALQNVRAQVRRFRTNNQPVSVLVEHNYRTIPLDTHTASIEDTYIAHTVRLDPTMMRPIERDPRRRIRRSYTMKEVGGIWKVTFIIGYLPRSS